MDEELKQGYTSGISKPALPWGTVGTTDSALHLSSLLFLLLVVQWFSLLLDANIIQVTLFPSLSHFLFYSHQWLKIYLGYKKVL
jgi:hypothetical protein